MKFNFFKKVWGRKGKSPEEEKKEEEIKGEKVVEEIPLQRGVDFKILPLITEKSLSLSREGKFTFLVDNKLNKPQIKSAIEKMFNVNVVDLKTMNYKKRVRGITRIKLVRPSFKKVIVKLKEGQTIPIFE